MNTSDILKHRRKSPRPNHRSTLRLPPSLKNLSFPKVLTTQNLDWQEPIHFFKQLSGQNPLIFLDGCTSRDSPNRSLIAWDPWLWIRGRRKALLVRKENQAGWKTVSTPKPYEIFQKLFESLQKECPHHEGLGAYGAFTYEAGEYFETLPQFPKSQNQTYFEFIFPRQVLLFYHQEKKCVWHSFKPFPRFQSLSPWTNGKRTNVGVRISQLRPEWKKEQFQRIVKRVKDYIAAGDIYQANLSQEITFRFQGDASSIYEKLRQVNPSPYSSYLRLGQEVLISSSPELLIRKKGDRCLTRPIAGTRPRGKDQMQDQRFSRSLLLSPKERAEHLMLLDLERNDLGRVCHFGTVRVEEQMVLERYSHVFHIVSQVGGQLLPGRNAFDCIRALFPGGTITGCPKIRSMEIIHELEKKPRNFYTGSLGFLGFSGEAVFNIIIRTIHLKGNRGSFRVGAGIVADSQPEREYEETLHKGQALLKALGTNIQKVTGGR